MGGPNSSFLDPLLSPTLQDDGTDKTRRANINYVGFTVEDDPTNDATKITNTGGGGSGQLAEADNAALRAIDVSGLSDGTVAVVQAPPDTWVLTKTTGAGMADDDRNVIKPAAISLGSNGRWRSSHGGPLPVTWFGADPSGNVDSAGAFTTTANASKHVLVPPGTYKLGSGWTVPRASVTIELSRGVILNLGGTLRNNFQNISWRGHSFGRAFNSDGSNDWAPNIVWTGTSGVAMSWADTTSVSADGCSLDGINIDGAAGLASQDFTAYLVGISGGTSGASGLQFDHFGGVDCWYGANFRSNFEQCGFHQPSFTMRDTLLSPQPPLGIGIGADAGGSQAITTIALADWGGSTVQGYKVQIQVGGTGGSGTSINVGGTGPGGLILSSAGGSGQRGIVLYNGLGLTVQGVHCELQEEDIVGATGNGVNPTILTLDSPTRIPTGATCRVRNMGGNTALNNTEHVGTVIDPTHISFAVAGNGTYTSGGSIVDVSTDPNVPVQLGSGSAYPQGVLIRDCYLSSGPIGQVKAVNWEGAACKACVIESSAGRYGLWVAAGAGQHRSFSWGPHTKVAVGPFWLKEVSDDTLGFDYQFPQGRGVADNVTTPELWTLGRTVPKGAYQFSTLGTRVPVIGDMQLGQSRTVSSATDTTPVVVTTTAAHNNRTGDTVHVTGNTAANGDWFVTYIDATSFSLLGSTAAGHGTQTGGTVYTASSFVGVYVPTWDVNLVGGGGFNLVNGQAFLTRNQVTASAGAPIQTLVNYVSYAQYWDGSAPSDRPLGFTSERVSTGPLVTRGLALYNGSVVFHMNDDGGFRVVAKFGLNKSPVAAQTLTDSTGGTPASSLVDVTTAGLADPAKINDNLASIRAALAAYGLFV